jgi:hypothetical protein
MSQQPAWPNGPPNPEQVKKLLWLDGEQFCGLFFKLLFDSCK